MTPAQQTELLTILHLHHVTHGLDVSELIERVKMIPVTQPLDEGIDIDTLAVKNRRKIQYLRKVYQHRAKVVVEQKVMDFVAEQRIPQYPIDTIINAVTSVSGIPFEQLASPKRDRPIMDARHLAVGLTYIHCLHMTLKVIGGNFNRHHTSTLHEFKMMRDLNDSDAGFADKRRKVEAILNGGKA
jgi:chromosomal replication initiation ATPase DnaA